MNPIRLIAGFVVVVALSLVVASAHAAGKPVRRPPEGYEHTKFAPDAEILRVFHGFAVSFDSKDDDDGKPGPDLLRVPHWVSQEVRRWEPPADEREDDGAWCLDTLKRRPRWFTDADLFAAGVAPNDDSYLNSGFDRGHMAMKLLVERLGQDAAYNTHTVLNAIPQRPKFNRGIWQNLEYLIGAWAQRYGTVWVIQGPVFHEGKKLAWIGDEGERKVAVPDAAFKVVIRHKTEEEKDNAASLDKEAPEVLAFLYPQLGPGYLGPSKEYRHTRFLTTVHEIEALTGLDFRPSENPAIEKRIERRRTTALWDPPVVNLRQRQLFLSGCKN